MTIQAYQCETCGLFHIEGTKCYKETKDFIESEKYFKNERRKVLRG